MLIKIEPKYNTKTVSKLMSKRGAFISSKLPTLRRWTVNRLYYSGIDMEGLDWRYGLVPIDYVTDELDPSGVATGQKVHKKRYTTKEKEHGKYRYNKQGIPTKVGEYISDIESRKVAHNVVSLSLGAEEKDLITKVIKDGLIDSSEWGENLGKVLEDTLVLGNGMMSSESFDLIRKIKGWSGQEEGKYNWSKKKEDLPYKRGVFSNYIDPECVFPEPGASNPTEMFIGKPYTYGELILNFPELEKKVTKPSGTNYSDNYNNSEEMIVTSNPFSYKLHERIIDSYNSYEKSFGDKDWVTSLTDPKTKLSEYNKISPDQKFWVWTYYNLAYNPTDDNSGDYMCIFMDNFELYSGPIVNADKDIPVVNFKFDNTSNYWSSSMVDKLKAIQDSLNERDNIKRTALEYASTSNIATNKDFIDDDFTVNRYGINVLDVSTKTEDSIASISNDYGKNLAIANVVQPFKIGNIDAIEANQADVTNLLMEMDGLYPKPTYKTQGLREDQQNDTLYSPNVEINNLIQRFTRGLGTVAEKYIKELIHNLKYVSFENKSFKGGVHLYGHLVKVVETQKDKTISQAKMVVDPLNKLMEQEAQQMQQKVVQEGGDISKIPKPPEPIKKEDINNIKIASEVIASAAQKEIVDKTVYFIYKDMVLLGQEDIKANVSFDQTKDQQIADMRSYINTMKEAGVFVDASSIGKRLSVLFGQDANTIASQAPDPILQSLINSGGLRVNSLLYPSDGATESIIGKFLQIDEKEFQWNPQDYNSSKWLMQSKIAHQQAKELEMVKGDERTKTGVTTEGARGENKMKLAKEESINDKIGGAIGESQVRDGNSMVAGDLRVPDPENYSQF